VRIIAMQYLCVIKLTKTIANLIIKKHKTMKPKELINRKTSFQCSYDMIPKGKIRQVLSELRQILGVTTDVNVYTYIRGDREPKLTEALEIERLFKKYGIEVK
jgi:hypothetical protein